MEPRQRKETTEVAQSYLNTSHNNYLKDLAGIKGIMDVNFEEEGWLMYEGFFRDGKRNGIGEMELTDGRIFTGEFSDG